MQDFKSEEQKKAFFFEKSAIGADRMPRHRRPRHDTGTPVFRELIGLIGPIGLIGQPHTAWKDEGSPDQLQTTRKNTLP